jgi:hypothetical protein
LTHDKTCFVISSIGEEGSQTRINSNLTFDYIIKPVVNKYGYNLNRADLMGKTGMISNHIIKQILDSDLVIADLTDYNPNVFYELAIRHITQKACIQMIKRGQNIPFDIYGIETIYFDTDLENAEIAKNKISEQIELIERGEFNGTNPITPVHTNPLIQTALQESKRDLTDSELLLSIMENVNYLTNVTFEVQREISDLKESRNYIGNLGNKVIKPDYTYSDLKQDLDSVNQELYLLESLYAGLKNEAETLEKTHPPGEAWMYCEAMATASFIGKRVEFLKNLKIELENIEKPNEIKTTQWKQKTS